MGKPDNAQFKSKTDKIMFESNLCRCQGCMTMKPISNDNFCYRCGLDMFTIISRKCSNCGDEFKIKSNDNSRYCKECKGKKAWKQS